jgi:hypothetical protein
MQKEINFIGIGKCKSLTEFFEKKIKQALEEERDYLQKDYGRSVLVSCYRDAYEQSLEAYRKFEEE